MMRSRLPVLALGLALAAASAQAQLQPKGPAKAPASASAQPEVPAGVTSNPEMEKAGQTAAHAWLLLLDRKDWGTAWDASSSMFRRSVPLPAWMDGIPKVRDPLGNFVERQPVRAAYSKQVAGQPEGDYVVALFHSKFTNKADVEETVMTVREPDGRWRVTGYQAK